MSKLFEAVVKHGELIKNRCLMTIVLHCIEFVNIHKFDFCSSNGCLATKPIINYLYRGKYVLPKRKDFVKTASIMKNYTVVSAFKLKLVGEE